MACTGQMLLALSCFLLVDVCLCATHGENLIWPDGQAIRLFHLSDANNDDMLTMTELQHIFADFDNNTDGQVTSEEFLEYWQRKDLGTLSQGLQLFLNVDVDRNFKVDMDGDFFYVFRWFDSNEDFVVTFMEFITNWVKIYSS